MNPAVAGQLHPGGIGIDFGDRRTGQKRESTVRVEVAETASDADAADTLPENAEKGRRCGRLRTLPLSPSDYEKDAPRPQADASSANFEADDCELT
jgi:hypothetical protein